MLESECIVTGDFCPEFISVAVFSMPRIDLLCTLILLPSPVIACDAPAPDARHLQTLVDALNARCKGRQERANVKCIPILDTVPSDWFGVVIVTRSED